MKIYQQILAIVVSLVMSSECWAALAKLTDLQVQANTNDKNIILELDNNVNYRWFLLSKPERLVVDLANTTLQARIKQLNLTNMPVSTVRAGMQKNKTLRLVFELNLAVKPHVLSQLTPNGGKRLIIALNGKNLATQPNQPTPSAPTINADVASKVSTAAIKPVMSVPTQSHRNVIVVIDPGHGGKDPGAIGARGTREKDVVLAISKDLASLLNDTQGYSAVLTRKGDTFIKLRGRLKLARKDKADMFVAIHADAFSNASAKGSSVFALSAHGASSEAARWLAERENYSELGGIDLNQLNDKGNVLRSVLIDLSQNATISSSLQLGSAMLHALGKLNNLHHNSVEQAPFMVLKSPDIPSVLVETGFLSNPIEEQNLRSSTYQHKIARALYQGIMDYFQQNPPEGTLIGSTTKPQRYIVVHGDTIASIARKFKTSITALKQTNNLTSNDLRLRQVLLIPR